MRLDAEGVALYVARAILADPQAGDVLRFIFGRFGWCVIRVVRG